ncbi:MAG: bile acid:sodium symporter family protein [Sedimentisphaerales bacterium]|nr:bile acid:sodium symporter family protein [Sedimentisphaerales bacterium]
MEHTSKCKTYLISAFFLTICEFVLILSGHGSLPVSGLLLFGIFLALSFAVKYTEKFKGLSFTFLIFACCAFTLYFPEVFTNWGFDTRVLIIPSIQLIMFGMGTKLNLHDFVREFSEPAKIFIGTAMVFLLMPIAAIIIVKVYGRFPNEVAAGIILVGACPGGVASNVMTYLARGNLPYSMTLTTFATLLSPLVTPLLMWLFAGNYIKVDVLKMMIDIINLMFVPVGAGIICNKILYGNMFWTKKTKNMVMLSITCFIIGLGMVFIPYIVDFTIFDKYQSSAMSLLIGLILVAWSVACVSITKIAVEYAKGPENWMDIVLPKLSLSAIMLYIIITAAHQRENILKIGAILFVATIVHNTLGYILGYISAKIMRLNDADMRALTIEVGLKNSGLAVGLAQNVLNSMQASLAPIIFGTWMNVSASSLASFWSQRKPREEMSTDGTANK